MKKLLFSLFFCGISFYLFSQQEQTLHFARSTFQSTYTNPAFFMEKKVNIALPSIYLNTTNTTFTWNKLLQKDGDSLVLDLRNIDKLMRDYNYIAAHANAEPLGLALHFGNLQVSAGAGVRSLAYFGYERGLFDLLAKGNVPFIGKKINIAPDFQISTATELNAGVAYRFLEEGKLAVGIKGKYLMGITDISTSTKNRTISVTTDPEFYQLRFETDYIIRSSNGFTGNSIDSMSVNNFQQFTPFTSNGGFGIDIGAEYKINNKFSVAASVVDIGRIRWKENNKELVTKGEYVYDGIRFNQLIDTNQVNFNTITDTLKKIFGFQTQDVKSYTTALPTRMYVSGTFRPIEIIQVGALLYGEGLRGRFNPGVVLSGNVQVKQWLNFGLTTGYRNKRAGNIGMSLALRGGPVQYYLVSDNILGAFVPRSTRNFNLRTGMNLVF